MKFCTFFIIYFCAFFAQAQNWEKNYEEGLAYFQAENHSQAIDFFEQSLQKLQKKEGKKNKNYLQVGSYLAISYIKTKQYEKAEKLLLEVKDLTKTLFGAEGSTYLQAADNLADLYQIQKHFPKAQAVHQEILTILAKSKGKESTEYVSASEKYLELCLEHQKNQEIETIYKEYKEIKSKLTGKEHYDLVSLGFDIADWLRVQKRFNEALPIYQDLEKVAERFEKQNIGYASQRLSALMAAYTGQGLIHLEQKNLQAAETLLKKVKTMIENDKSEDNPLQTPEYATACENLAGVYETQNKYQDAESLFLEAKNIRAKVFGVNHPDYALSCYNLGRLYFSCGKYAEAEKYCKEACDVMAQFDKNHPKYITYCEDLVEVYEKLGKKAEAQKIREEIKRIKK